MTQSKIHLSLHAQERLAIGALLLSATLWGVLWYPLRLLEQAGLHGLWTTLLMYLATLPFSLWLIIRHRDEWRRQPWLLLGIMLITGWCNAAFILAVLEGNVVRVVLLFYLSPLWSTLFGWWFLKERLTSISWLVLGIAMLGGVAMLWNPAIGLPIPQSDADWLALSSGFSFSASNIMIRAADRVSVRTKTAASWVGGIIVAAVALGLLSLPMAEQVTANTVIAALMLGLVMVTLMTLAVQYGVSHMPVYRSAIILMFELVAAAVTALWLTDEVISDQEWLGGSLIILATVISAYSLLKNDEN